MSKEINNGGTCPFCFNKVHPQAVACNGCGASYQKEYSRTQDVVIFFCTILVLILLGIAMFNGAENFAFLVLLPAYVGGLIFIKSRMKYVWVRRRQ